MNSNSSFNSQFRIWINKHYSIYHGGWALKSKIKNADHITPQIYTYDELYKYWLENVKDK